MLTLATSVAVTYYLTDRQAARHFPLKSRDPSEGYSVFVGDGMRGLTRPQVRGHLLRGKRCRLGLAFREF